MWLALFRVHTTKPFSRATLLSVMRIAWSTAKEISFKVLGSNFFPGATTILGYWTRVMVNGPWLFRGLLVVIKVYDGFSNVHEYKLDRILVWA